MEKEKKNGKMEKEMQLKRVKCLNTKSTNILYLKYANVFLIFTKFISETNQAMFVRSVVTLKCINNQIEI